MTFVFFHIILLDFCFLHNYLTAWLCIFRAHNWDVCKLFLFIDFTPLLRFDLNLHLVVHLVAYLTVSFSLGLSFIFQNYIGRSKEILMTFNHRRAHPDFYLLLSFFLFIQFFTGRILIELRIFPVQLVRFIRYPLLFLIVPKNLFKV